MVGSSEITHHRPTSGGLLHLHIRLTGLNKWIGPLCAAACGVLVGGSFTGDADAWLRLALLVLLVDGGWGSLWAAMAATDWSTPIERWRQWGEEGPNAAFPHETLGASNRRATRWFVQIGSWWQATLWPSAGSALSSAIVAVPLITVLSIMLGPQVMVLSIASVAVMQLGLIWEGGHGNVIPEWDAMPAIALPWLAGQAAFGPITLPSATIALCFAVAYGTAWRVKSKWGLAFHILAQLLAPVLLILLSVPAAAAAYVALLVPQFLLLPWMKGRRLAGWYVAHSRWWLFATMVLSAVALWA